MNVISSIPITLIGLFMIFILSKKHKNAGDFALLAYNCSLILIVLFDFKFTTQGITGAKLLLHFNGIFWLSSTLLIYAYTLLAKNRRIVVKWWFFIFSLPFLLFSFWDLILMNKSAAALHDILNNPGVIYQLFFKLHKIFIIIICFFLLKQIKSYEIDLKNTFSHIENRSLHWLKNYLILTICIYSIHLIVFLLYNFEILESISLAYMFTGIITVLAALYLSFFGIRFYNFPIENSNSQSGNVIVKAEITEETSISKEIHKPKLSDVHSKSSENEMVFNQVNSLFMNEEIFKDPDLRIGKVAEAIGIPVHKVSEAINEQFKKPFYHFVAHYRCEALKEKLQDTEYANYTILGLAMDVGFNSKSSLNRIFKEQTGQTPSQYKKSHLAK